MIKHVLVTLINIAGRRSSSQQIAIAFIDAIIISLKEKYEFFKYIEIKDVSYFDGNVESFIRIKSNINHVKPELAGESVESVVRVLCMDLEEETGLYFIKELTERLGAEYLLYLKQIGVDLDLLKIEQKHLHEQLEKKKMLIDHESEQDFLEKNQVMLNYSWDEVESFKYRNNVCFLYDKNGKLLDKLQLNQIIEYYIRTVTDFGKLILKSEEAEVTEKQLEFMEMLYSRDLDYDTALYLLHISDVEFGHIIQKLLRYEYLQYVSSDEIRLTEKGIKELEEKKKKSEKVVAS